MFGGFIDKVAQKGVSPYFLGAKIKTTIEHTTLTERYTEGKRTLKGRREVFSGELAGASAELQELDGTVSSSDVIDTFAINAALDVCGSGSYRVERVYDGRDFDATTNTESTATENTDTSACYDHFIGLKASFSESLTGIIVDSTSLSFSTTSEDTPLTGNGLQFGYNFKKFRVSLNSYLWSAGENKLDSQLLLLDYFLPYGLYLGGGFGVAKLDTSIDSASKTAPAFHFGYQLKFTNSFSLEAGLLWFGASFLLEKSDAAPEATISNTAIIPDPIVSSALVGGTVSITETGTYSFQDNRDGTFAPTGSYSHIDNRILVTRTSMPIYGEAKSKTDKTLPKLTKTTVEVEAPTSLFIRFVWKFR